jgi:hypothetical protein
MTQITFSALFVVFITDEFLVTFTFDMVLVNVLNTS